MFKNKQDPEAMPAEPSMLGEVQEDSAFAHDEVGWFGTSALMMKTQIGLGVLSIPAAFDVPGMVPGVICLVAIAAITTWSNYIVGVFKLNHREIYGIDDAAQLMFGRVGREILGAGFALYLIFGAGSVASGIPVFGGLVSLIGALLGTLQCFQPMGCMWLYDNWVRGKEQRSLRWILMVCWSVFVITAGMFLMFGGAYGSIVSIIDAYKADGGSRPWACADKSNSV
ncbi:hypothetical protein ACJ41O_007314 [Fusarium nematophilum]